MQLDDITTQNPALLDDHTSLGSTGLGDCTILGPSSLGDFTTLGLSRLGDLSLPCHALLVDVTLPVSVIPYSTPRLNLTMPDKTALDDPTRLGCARRRRPAYTRPCRTGQDMTTTPYRMQLSDVA